MNNFKHIQIKLNNFIKKYYTNEIIKGSILFVSFGLLYFILTLLIEYFLWLTPTYRTLLFWIFISVELALLTRFILFPVFKLFGLRKGITDEDAAQIIGSYFTEIDDKLLNIIQLHNEKETSELLLASIEQKSQELDPIPFKKAIHYGINKKYLKYLSLPVLIWLFTSLIGSNSVFTQSLERVVHHQKFYQPPAPFSFQVLNDRLEVIEGNDFILEIEIVGEIIPEYVKVLYNEETYLLKKESSYRFSHKMESLNKSLSFYLEADNIYSKPYKIQVIPTPAILDFKMEINYPDYTGRPDQIIKNTGNISAPEGTLIKWKLHTRNTDRVLFTYGKNEADFKKEEEIFRFEKLVKSNLSYQISTTNKQLSNYEKLNFKIDVIQDEFPQIKVKSDIDSITRGEAHFFGQISDDYGISYLNVVYSEMDSDKLTVVNLPVDPGSFQEFFFTFPYRLELEENKIYQIYFQVFDNDKINGKKSAKSKTFYYHNKSQQQKAKELLEEQKRVMDDLRSKNRSFDELNSDIKEFNKKLKSKSELDWNDKRQLDQYLQRQKNYMEMMQKDADKILENIKESDIDQEEEDLNATKEELQNRIEELKEIQKNEKLLDELQKLSEKLKKEGLIDKLERLSQKTVQQNRSLERLLELTKRFYVERKTSEILKELDSLAKHQEDLSKKSTKNNFESQRELTTQFDSIQKDLNNLRKDNEDLKSPLPIPDTENTERSIREEMEKAGEQLKNEKDMNAHKTAAKNQQSASNKIKEMHAKIKSSMLQMAADMNEENEEDLLQILDNLLIFSFDQEALMISLNETDINSLDLPGKLKRQQILKDYFEHIDDSLYTLSMRMVRISSRIEKELTDVHYNIDKSLGNLSESKIERGIKNQHYTLTATNNLADLLSEVLKNIQNQMQSSGQGNAKKSEEISLPDIIKKQEDLLNKMKNGLSKRQAPNQKTIEQLSGEQYEFYKQQNAIKEAFEKMVKESNNHNTNSESTKNRMEQLEKLLLDKGFNKESFHQMQILHQQLLQLEKATYDKGFKAERRSKSGNTNSYRTSINQIKSRSYFLDQEDLLIRKPLPLKPYYQRKVTEYFKINNHD